MTVEVLETSTEVVEVIEQGPAGPLGIPGAAGNDTEVMYNDAGFLHGIPNLRYDKVTGDIFVGSPLNHTKFDSNGFMTFAGNARPAKHLPIPLVEIGTGETKPTLVRIDNFVLYEFGVGDEAIFSVEIPHDIDGSAEVAIHFSWLCDEAYATNNSVVSVNTEYTLVLHDESEAIDAAALTGTLIGADLPIPGIAKAVAHTAMIVPGDINFHHTLGLVISRIASSNDTAKPVALLSMHLEYYSDTNGTSDI